MTTAIDTHDSRAEGHYWWKQTGAWEPVRYDSILNRWYVIGDERYLITEELEALGTIGDRIDDPI